LIANVLALLVTIGATAFIFINIFNFEIEQITAAVEAARLRGIEKPEIVIGPPGLRIENPALIIALTAATMVGGFALYTLAARFTAAGC